MGISPNKDGTYAYVNGQWSKVGGPMEDIIAGGGKVYGIYPHSHDIHQVYYIPIRSSFLSSPLLPSTILVFIIHDRYY